MDTTITSDEEFLDQMKEIKSMLKNTTIPEMKTQEAEVLRIKIADVLSYVMSKMQEVEPAEAEPEAASPSYEETPAVPSENPPTAPMAGGKTRKRVQRQRGGSLLDMARVTNTGGITSITKDPYSAISGSPDLPVSENLHAAFSAGNSKGFSSIDGMPVAEVNAMLPSYGTMGGGASRRRARGKKV